jgi:phospholipid transport system substrate-binding protein
MTYTASMRMANYPELSLSLISAARRLFAAPVVLLYALTVLAPTAAAEAEAPDDATAVVDTLHDALLEAMRGGESMGFDGRYDLLAPVVADLFDTPLISRVILGRHWDELDDAQKAEFIELFNQLSTATYANQFDRYAGESFQHAGIEPLTRGRILVKTEMLQSNGDRVRFDYLMHEQDGNWYIISVVANGVNDLSLKRAEYAAVIRSRGYDGLIRELQGKIAEYELAKSGEPG